MNDRLERLSLANARVPFRLKTTAVSLGVLGVLAYFFYVAKFETGWMLDHAGFIAGGLQNTIVTSFAGIAIATVLALVGALSRISSNSVAYGISGLYVSFFRGTPLIVQMFLVYLALPQIGTNLHTQYPEIVTRQQAESLVLNPMLAGILVLGLNYGAYMTEIFRAGIESVASGQGEAAEALGMTYGQRMRKVVLPQALRVIVPPTGNMFISMLKDSSLVSFLGVTVEGAEIFRRAQLAGRTDFHNLEALLLAAGMYWGLTILLTYFQQRLERRMAGAYVRAARLPTTAALPAVREKEASNENI